MGRRKIRLQKGVDERSIENIIAGRRDGKSSVYVCSTRNKALTLIL